MPAVIVFGFCHVSPLAVELGFSAQPSQLARRCGIVDEEVDEATCDTSQLFEEMLQLSFVTNLVSSDHVGIVVVPCVLAMSVKPLWNCRHLSLRGGCSNDVVHSMRLIVGFVFRGVILELNENIR